MNDNRLFHLIEGGAVLSGTLLSLSLFSYFQPELAAKAMQTASASISAVLSPAPELTETIPLEAEENHPMLTMAGAGIQDSPFSSTPEEKNAEALFSETETMVAYHLMLDTSLGSMQYFNQGDSRWGDYLYGGSDPMKKYGCGPTVSAMLISSFSHIPEASDITPVELADWSAANGFYAPHSGSYHSLIQAATAAYGLHTVSVRNRSCEQASALLSSGHILVALMGKGTFTDNGHYILITKLSENGMVRIADPNSYENTEKEWDLNLILSELKKSYDSGGPLWAVSFSNGS